MPSTVYLIQNNAQTTGINLHVVGNVTNTRHLTHNNRQGCWPNPFYLTLNSEQKVRTNLDTGCYGLHPKSRLLESVKLKRRKG